MSTDNKDGRNEDEIIVSDYLDEDKGSVSSTIVVHKVKHDPNSNENNNKSAIVKIKKGDTQELKINTNDEDLMIELSPKSPIDPANRGTPKSNNAASLKIINSSTPTSPSREESLMKRKTSMLQLIKPSHAPTDGEEEDNKPPPPKPPNLTYTFERWYYLFDTKIQKVKWQAYLLIIFGILSCMFVGLFWYFIAGKSSNYAEAVWACYGFLTDTSKEVLDLDESTIIADTKNEMMTEYNIEVYNLLQENPNATIPPIPIFDAIVDYNYVVVKIWSMRIVGVMQSVFGIVFMATVIAIVVDLVRAKLDQLKEGKSNVVETNHIVMLGWTEKSISILSELADANSSEGGCVVVVLTDIEKESVEKDIDGYFSKGQLMGTKVIVRRGSPVQSTDLMKLSIQYARAIIILSTTVTADKVTLSADQSDAQTVQTILSIKSLNIPRLFGFMVCEMRDADNQVLAEIVGGDEAEVIVAHDIIGRLMVMASKQPGLSKVYDSILGFEGDEFYIQAWPELEGQKFSTLLLRFPEAIVFGIRTPKGKLFLNPDHNYILNKEDEVIVIAEDNDTYKPKEAAKIECGIIPKKLPDDFTPQKVMICGWRRDIRDVIKLLDDIMPLGSEVHFLNTNSIESRVEEFADSGFFPEEDLVNIKLIHYIGAPTVRRYMENMQIEEYRTGLIFSDESLETDILASDSLCISALLLIRDIQHKYEVAMKKEGIFKQPSSFFSPKALSSSPPQGMPLRRGSSNSSTKIVVSELSFPLVCEILDPRTQKTIKSNAAVSERSDFIQSNDIISKMIAMVVENRDVKMILDELLGAEGNAFSVRPSSLYVMPGEKVCFFEVALRAQKLGEILVGYQLNNGTEDSVCNPKDKLVEKVWDHYDMILLVPPPPEHLHTTHKKRASKQGIDLNFLKQRSVKNINKSKISQSQGEDNKSFGTSLRKNNSKIEKLGEDEEIIDLRDEIEEIITNLSHDNLDKVKIFLKNLKN